MKNFGVKFDNEEDEGKAIARFFFIFPEFKCDVIFANFEIVPRSEGTQLFKETADTHYTLKILVSLKFQLIEERQHFLVVKVLPKVNQRPNLKFM